MGRVDSAAASAGSAGTGGGGGGVSSESRHSRSVDMRNGFKAQRIQDEVAVHARLPAALHK